MPFDSLPTPPNRVSFSSIQLVSLDSYLAPVPVVLVRFLSREVHPTRYILYSDPFLSTRNPRGAIRDLPSSPDSFILHIFLISCPKFRADRLRVAEYPPGAAGAASAPEAVVVGTADLQMAITQTSPRLKKAKSTR